MSEKLLSRSAVSAATLALVVLMGCSGSSPATAGKPARSTAGFDPGQVTQKTHAALCADPNVPGVAHCHAQIVTNAQGAPDVSSTPQGLTPSDLRSAYQLPTSGGHGALIAIVDANDDPNAESDLAAYRQQFGLPPCTSSNGCFKKVNQRGVEGSYPTADPNWAGEISLDLDMVSAGCPDCHILLVEADSATLDNLGSSVNTAVSLGAVAVSNSYGGGEDPSLATLDAKYFNHPGVTITASSGDRGFGAQFPATSAFVTAVGGTSLVRSSSDPRGWTEGVWGSSGGLNGGTGSGCSSIISKPSWQTDTACSKRMESDVSAVADPSTGVAIFDTFGSSGGGWAVVGGTSASAPLVAAIYAVTGHAGEQGSFSYKHPEAFVDVTVGTNGTCPTAYFCNAGTGYDGPTGNGVPNAAVMVTIPGPTQGSDGGTGGGTNTAAVTFQADNAVTVFGQNVFVVGDAPALGSWDPTKGVALAPTQYPNWTGLVTLPQGLAVNYKFVIIDGAGNVTWEPGSNHSLTVPTTVTAQAETAW